APALRTGASPSAPASRWTRPAPGNGDRGESAGPVAPAPDPAAAGPACDRSPRVSDRRPPCARLPQTAPVDVSTGLAPLTGTGPRAGPVGTSTALRLPRWPHRGRRRAGVDRRHWAIDRIPDSH